jgi:hypothetical protein
VLKEVEDDEKRKRDVSCNDDMGKENYEFLKVMEKMNYSVILDVELLLLSSSIYQSY